MFYVQRTIQQGLPSNVEQQQVTEPTGARECTFLASKSACTITKFCIMTIPLVFFTMKAFQTFVRG